MKQILSSIIAVWILFAAAQPISAQESVTLNGKDVKIGQNEIVFQVKGLVCSFCSYGLQKGLSKLEFVDKNQFTKGVFTDIDHQYTVVAIKEGADADIESARKIIIDSGYEVLNAFTNPTGKSLQKTSFTEAKNEG